MQERQGDRKRRTRRKGRGTRKEDLVKEDSAKMGEERAVIPGEGAGRAEEG